MNVEVTDGVEDKIDGILDWADDKSDFDEDFVLSVQERFEKRGSITEGQDEALDNIIVKFGISI